MRMCSFLLATVAVSASVSAAAADPACPAHDASYVDHVAASMTGKSCADAARIAETCALGVSSDVQIASAAAKVCRADFASRRDDVALFAQLAKRCEAKFAKQDGTMYVSMEAYCELRVAALLSSLNTAVR